MNWIMLKHLHAMLCAQKFESITIFMEDTIGVEHLSQFDEVLAKTRKLDVDHLPDHELGKEKEKERKEGNTIKEKAEARRERQKRLKSIFYPSDCIQQLSVIAHAVHSETKERLIGVFSGMEQGNDSGKLRKKILENIVADLNSSTYKVSHILFIHAGEITPQARDFIRLGHPTYKFQLFLADSIRQNLMTYHLMPRIKVCTEEEKQKLFQTKRVPIQKLPRIWQTDRVIHYLNSSCGDIVSSDLDTLNGYRFNYRHVIEEAKDKKVSNKPRKKEK